MSEQPALDRNRFALGNAHEAAERALTANDAMAGDHQGNGIRAAGADSKDGKRRTHLRSVDGWRSSRWLTHGFPHPCPSPRGRGVEFVALLNPGYGHFHMWHSLPISPMVNRISSDAVAR